MSLFGRGADRLPVVFISSALTADSEQEALVFEYFVLMMAHLSLLFSNKGIDVILKVPKSQRRAAADQAEFLQQLTSGKLDQMYSGVIIAPFEKAALVGPLRNYLKTF